MNNKKRFTAFYYGFKKGMHSFGMTISAIINGILLLVVYILGVGIPSIIAKIFRKRFLSLKTSKSSKTYWQKRDTKKKPIDSYYRQF